MDQPQNTTARTEQYLVLAESLTPMIEIVAGQREVMIANGFSPTAAEHMAASLYASLIAGITK